LFGYLHSFIRQAFIREIQNLLDEHPFYTRSKDSGFQRSPVIVSEKYNFDGRQFPAVIVDTSSASEFRLDFTNFIEDVYGNVRLTSIIPYVVTKVETDKTYSKPRTDNVYGLQFVNIGRDNKREINLRVSDGNAGTYSYFAVKPWEVRNDIIPGAILFFGSFNDIEPGKVIYIETFKDTTMLGELYGKGFDFSISINVYAQSQNEAKELTDLINAYGVYILPQHLYNAHGFVLKSMKTDGVIEKDGELGEEVFKGGFSVDLWTEHQFFVPVNKAERYTLWVELRERVDHLVNQLWQYTE